MSSGDARRSQLAISFNVFKKQGETSTQRSTKRLREDRTFNSRNTDKQLLHVYNHLRGRQYQFKTFNSSTTTEQ